MGVNGMINDVKFQLMIMQMKRKVNPPLERGL